MRILFCSAHNDPPDPIEGKREVVAVDDRRVALAFMMAQSFDLVIIQVPRSSDDRNQPSPFVMLEQLVVTQRVTPPTIVLDDGGRPHYGKRHELYLRMLGAQLTHEFNLENQDGRIDQNC